MVARGAGSSDATESERSMDFVAQRLPDGRWIDAESAVGSAPLQITSNNGMGTVPVPLASQAAGIEDARGNCARHSDVRREILAHVEKGNRRGYDDRPRTGIGS